MTLHEAIELVLIEFGGAMTAQEIVEVINEKGLYKKATGESITANQILARVNNYPNLFYKIGNEIMLQKRSNGSLNNLLFYIADQLRSKSIINPDLVLGFLLFYFRSSELRAGEKYFGTHFKDGFGPDLESHIMDAVKRLSRHPDFAHESDELVFTFRSLNSNILLQIISDLRLFDFSANSISHDEFSKTFNYFLNSFSGWGRDSGESSTPELISKYISSLISIKPSETLCDPFAGNAGLACKLLKFHDGSGCVLQDINAVSVILGKMNLILNGVNNIKYHQGNSIDLYTTKLENRRFDYVVTHPPFGLKYRDEDIFKLPVNFLGSSAKGENIHIQLVLHLLQPYGKAILLIQDGFLFTNDSSSKEIKKMLILNDWIEAVHSFPFGSFKPYSSVNTSLLIINKNKSSFQRGKIIFKQVSEEELGNIGAPEDLPSINSLQESIYHNNNGNSVIVDIEKVEQNDFLLNTNRYLNEIELGPEYQTIESVLRNYSTGVTISKKYLDFKEGIPFITIKDLADSEIDFVITSNEISTYVGKMSLVKTNAIVQDGAILVAKVGNKLKPTIFSAQTSTSYAAFSSNIIALYPEESAISKEYLVAQLNQPYFKKQLDQIRAGSTQVFLQLKDLLQLRIKVPPLLEQEKELLKIYRTKDQSHRISKTDREQVEEYTQGTLISALKHEFSNLQVLLDGGITALRLFINRKVNDGASISWDEKIVDISDARTLAQIIAEQEMVLREMGDLFVDMQSILNLKRSNIKRERVELKGFFKEQVNQMNSQLNGVTLFFELNEKQKKDRYITLIDKSLFSKVVKNFLLNSIKHGFSGNTVDEKIILFDFAVSEDELWIEITMMNNGRKLPEGFTFEDFISFGGKSGTSRGAGIGGYLMNRAVQLHDGTLELQEFPEGTILYVNSTNSSIGDEAIAILSKTFIPGIAFKIRLPYKD
ncbi:MAG: N-6 DNA methylase [Cyclobacteriaceae bacterium]|jgi:type I restriction-modification system DNA methylase subunit|nr:N-6 DNA methylase [Cytophagales bacterium]MCZ8327803.1 N-6 DNA methylase [Cyclobacteriaceae bacterium]